MKLKDDIFKITDRTTAGSNYGFTVILNPDCDIYRGHFPGNPITPGVVMMGIARELMEDSLETSLTLESVPSVKYTSILSPVDNNVIQYKIDCLTDGNTIKAKIEISGEKVSFARMSLVWNKA